MSELRIESADLDGKGVIGLADCPELSTLAMQEKLDELATDVIVPKFNGLIDALEAASGAQEIGFCDADITAQTVGDAISEVKDDLDAAVLAAGNMPLGGAAGQVLCKASAADNDTQWYTHRLTASGQLTTAWTGDSAPYTQEVAVTGMLATDEPHITPVYSSTLATAIAQKEAWANVSKAEAGAGKVTFTCFEDKPTVAIDLQIEVIR